MKRLTLFILSLSVFISCATDEEPTATCIVNGLTIFDESPTRFVYKSDGAEGYTIPTIAVYENTDSSFIYSYTYNGSKINTISSNEDGANVVYTAGYDNDKLSLLTADVGDIVLKYSGSNVTTSETWFRASDGILYQVGHNTMTYDGSGNMTRNELKFDILMFITVAFGIVPTDPYAPASFGSVEYEYGQDNAPNPLYGFYFIENPDMSFLKNMPITVINKDASGSVTESQGFTISFNESGYPIKSTSGDFYIEASYQCN